VSHDPEQLLADYARLQGEAQALRDPRRTIPHRHPRRRTHAPVRRARSQGPARSRATRPTRQHPAGHADRQRHARSNWPRTGSASPPTSTCCSTAPKPWTPWSKPSCNWPCAACSSPKTPQDEPASELLKKIRAEKDKPDRRGQDQARQAAAADCTDDEKPFELPAGWEWAAISASFLVLWLQSDLFVGTIDPGRSNGVPHISTKQVAGLVLGLPPLAEQSRIVARVEALRRLCADLRQRLAAGQTTQALLAGALVENVV
jgi:hypothetical protein